MPTIIFNKLVLPAQMGRTKTGAGAGQSVNGVCAARAVGFYASEILHPLVQ